MSPSVGARRAWPLWLMAAIVLASGQLRLSNAGSSSVAVFERKAR